MTFLKPTGQGGWTSRFVDSDERAARLSEGAAEDSNGAAALAAFTALSPKLAVARTAVSSANFGPIEISDSCDYDCNFKEWRWWFTFDGRAALPFPATLGVMDCGSVYTTAFATVTSLFGSFAGTTAELEQQVGVIDAIDEKVRKEGEPTRQQVLDLIAAFKAANAAVTSSEHANDTSIQEISAFDSQYQGYSGALQAQVTSTQQSFDEDITQWRNKLLGDAKCGTGTLTSKFQGVTETVNASVASLSPSFTAVRTSFGAALTAVSRVLGNLVAMQASYSAVLDALSDAEKLDPTSPIRQVKLDLAKKTFTSLVSYADTNLKT